MHRVWLTLLTMMLFLVIGCSDSDTESSKPSGDGDVVDTHGDDGASPGDVIIKDSPTPEVHPDDTATPDTSADTIDVAAPVDTVVVTCEEGEPCDDLDPCTSDDACVEGICKGTPFTCDDGISCTRDICDGAGGCTFPLKEGFCYIEESCYAESEPNPELECMGCVTAIATDAWSTDDMLDCDDGDPCTQDHCSGGTCIGVTDSCDDHDPCTDDFCEPDVGCKHVFVDNPCSDGDACTLGDKCVNGTCQPGVTPLDCDDGNPCTDDVCDPEGGCSNTPHEGGCDDGNVCTVGDTCVDGACVSGDASPPCDDDNPCTDDLCHPVHGCYYFNNTAPCEDGDICTDGDSCLGGMCLSGSGIYSCDDGNVCTVDTCETGVGCAHAPISGPSCDDGDACTKGDFCLNGTCYPGLNVMTCNDGNDCTDDTCVPGEGCAFIPNTAPCNDYSICTVDDKCQDGECIGGTLVLDCDDGNACTTDFCHAQFGCMSFNNADACDDGDICTSGDFCAEGTCHSGYGAYDCNDGNPCTLDSCESEIGCYSVNDPDGECSDFDSCTTGDTCVEGECVGTPVTCDDGYDCTSDACDPTKGCVFTLLDIPECHPKLFFEYPPRGIEMVGTVGEEISIYGHVEVPAGEIVSLKVNGEEVPWDEQTLEWLSYMVPTHGMNILTISMEDSFGNTTEHVQSFYWTMQYLPMDFADPTVNELPDGIILEIMQSLLDDYDRSDYDDLVTYAYAALESLDIKSLIPNPVAEQSAAWCDFTVYVTNVSTGPYYITAELVDGVPNILFNVKIPDIDVDFKADGDGFMCPSAKGDAHVDYITVTIQLGLFITDENTIGVKVVQQTSDISPVNITLDGVIGFLFNWVVNFFEDDLTDMLKDTVADALDGAIAPVFEGFLNGFDLNQEIPIESPLGGPPIIIKLSAKPYKFSTVSGVLRIHFAPSVTTTQGTTIVPLGSPRWNYCGTQEGPPPSEYPTVPFEYDMGLSLWDDLINEILYAVFWSGLLNTELGSDVLGDTDLSQYGMSDLAIELEPMLPPMITDCFPDEEIRIQLGDLKIHASFVFDAVGGPVEMDLFVSFQGVIQLQIVYDDDNNPNLSFAIQEIEFVEMELDNISQSLAGMEGIIISLLEDTMMPTLMEQIGDLAYFSFPIPNSFTIPAPMDGMDDITLLLNLPELLRYSSTTRLPIKLLHPDSMN